MADLLTPSLATDTQPQQEDEAFLTSPTPTPDVAVTESTANMGGLKVAEEDSMRVFKEQQRTLAKKSLDNKELYKLYPGMQDADETAPGISDTASVMLNLSYRTGKPIQEVMTNFDEYKAGYAKQNGWDLGMSESGMRSKLNEQFKVEDTKQVAFNELFGNVVLKAFQDTGMGKNRASVSLPTEYVKEWEAKHKDLISGDAGYHAQANSIYKQTLKDIESIRGKGAETFSALMDFTQGKADNERITEVAEHLSSSSPDERKKVYRYIGVAAEAGHIDRAGIEQFAINMGQSFTRGFDFVPQGTLQQQENAFREMRDTLATGKVWLKSESGTPTLNDIYRPSQGATGSAINISLAGREATPEEVATLKAQAEGGLKTFGVIRELRNVAKSNIDPIRPVFNDSAIERGAYGLAGSLGLMVPVAINPMIGTLAYQAQEYDRIMLENPDINPTFAQGLALFEGAGNAALDRLQLGAINGKLPVFGGILNGIKSNGIRRVLTTVGVEIAEQNLQEGAQDLIAPLTETLTAALRQDMPDKDFGALMKDYATSRAETFFAVLPLALLGGGIGTYRDLKNPAMQMADRQLAMAGFGPAQRDYINQASSLEEKATRVEQEWSNRTEKDITAGKEQLAASIAEAKSQKESDTVEVNTKADGTNEWIVREATGKEVARVSTEEEAVTIIADRGEAAIKSQANVVADLLDSDWRKDKLPNFEAQFGGEVTPEQMLKDAEAKGDTKMVEAIKASIEAHGNDPKELSKLRILGESWVTPYAEGQYKAFVKLNEGHTVQDAAEEIVHGIFDIDVAEGRITKEQAREWVSQTAAAGVAGYKFGNDAEVRESMAQIFVDFAHNKLDQANLPSSFVAFLKKLYTEFVEFMRRAKLLDKAFAEGKIDAEFERYLSEKIGLSDASMIEREVSRIEGEEGVRLYRGTEEGGEHYGFKGKFYSRNRKAAEQYGSNIEEIDFPANAKILTPDNQEFESVLQEFEESYPDDSMFLNESPEIDGFMFPSEEWVNYLQSKGYDGTSIGKDAEDVFLFDKEDQKSFSIRSRDEEALSGIKNQDDWLEKVSEGTTHHDSLYRAGNPRTKHPFMARSMMDLDSLASGIEADTQAHHGVFFKNPLVVKSKTEASQKLFGEDILQGVRAKVGEVSENSKKILEADDRIGDAAEKAGYDAIVYPRDIQIIDKSILPIPERVDYNEESFPINLDTGEELYYGIGYDRILERVNQGTSSFSIRARDEAYDAAVKSGDEETQQRLVDEAAKEAGYTSGIVYHGSSDSNITSFDTSKQGAILTGDWGKGVYFTPVKWLADTYRQGAIKATDTSIKDAWDQMSKIAEGFGTSPMMEWIDLRNKKINQNQYDLIKEAEGVWRNKLREAEGGDSGKVYDSFLKLENPMVYQYEGMTDPYLEGYAKSKGHDGIIIQNKEGDTEEILAFDPSQIKSADPITRDDEGNVIPLSQRFNPKSNDIRYSIRNLSDNSDQVKPELLSPKDFEEASKTGVIHQATGQDLPAEEAATTPLEFGEINGYAPKDIAHFYSKRRGGDWRHGAYELVKDAHALGRPINADLWDEVVTKKPKGYIRDGGFYLPKGTTSLSIQSQDQIDRVNKAVADTTQFAEGRMALYERAKDRFKGILAENKDILDALKAGGALPETIRRAKLLQGIAELEVILRQLPAEVRGKVGGFGVLARGGTGDTFLANFFRDRVRMIDEQLEKYLSKEYDEELYRIFERAKPKKDQPGEKPKGIGAEIQALFAELKEAQKWSPEKLETELAKLETELDQIERSEANGWDEIQSKAKEEAKILQSINLLSKVGGWNPKYAEKVKADGSASIVKVYNGKTSNEKSDAIRALKEAWAKGYYEFQMKKIKEREEREGIQSTMKDSTNKAGTDAERIQKRLSEMGMAAGWGKSIYDLSSFDQVVNLIFGDNSEIANELSDIQRKTENQKEDNLQRKYEEVEDLFTKLAGGSTLKGKQLQYDMMQPSIKFTEGAYKGIELSQMQAISDLMMWNQDDGKRHMEGRYDENGKPISKWHYTQTFIDRLENKLTPKARAVMDFLLTKYAEEHPEINKVYKPLNGVSLISIENYAPLSVVPQQQKSGQMVDPTTGQSFSSASITPRSLLTRGTSIAQPDITVDAVQKYLSHTRQMEHWKAFAPVMAKYGTALRNRDVLDSIEAKAGRAGRTAMTNWLDYMTNGGVREAGASLWTNKMASDVMGRAAQIALFGRVGTILLQTTQLAAASAVMPHGAYMMRLTKLLTGNLDWTAATKSDYIQRRIKQMPVIEQQAMQELATARPSRVIEIQRLLGASLSAADGLFTGGTFAMVYDYQLKQAKENGMVGTDAEDFALNEAERITDRIAQPTRPGARSMWELTATSPAARLAFSFASEPRKNLALLLYAKKTDGVLSARFWRAATYTIFLSGVLSALARNAWKDMKDDSDDEWFDEKHWGWKRLSLMAITDPANGIPLVGSSIQEAALHLGGVYYQNDNLMSLNKGTSTSRQIPKYWEGDWTADQVMRDVDTVLSIAGMANQNMAAYSSLSHLTRDAFGVAKNAKKEVIGE